MQIRRQLKDMENLSSKLANLLLQGVVQARGAA